MISFACKQIGLKDLLTCSFSLNKTEYNLFTFLLDQTEQLCVSTIGEMTAKDRTTVQKAIKQLVAQGLVDKHQINLQTGGYTFVYKLKNKELIRSKMLDIVERWHKGVLQSIERW